MTTGQKLLVIFVLLGLAFGLIWTIVREYFETSKRLTDDELKTIRRAYEEVRELRDDAIESGDVEGVRDHTELLSDLKAIAKRQGKELAPNEGTRSIN